MAAIFFPYNDTKDSFFKGGLSVNNAIQIDLLDGLIGPEAMLIVTEVTMQHRDTIQYFLTFNDFISYLYFGKGLGNISVSGSIFSDCNSQFFGLSYLLAAIEFWRGKTTDIHIGQLGAKSFKCVLSSFTLRSSSEELSMNIIDFNLQFEIIDNSFARQEVQPSC